MLPEQKLEEDYLEIEFVASRASYFNCGWDVNEFNEHARTDLTLQNRTYVFF